MPRWLERLILVAGLVMIGVMVWHFDPAEVWRDISRIGWLGFTFVIAFQLFDHLLNALGWRYAFSPEDAKGVPLRLLIIARVAGDGVNYLTLSASIAGELVRPGMLGPVKSAEVKNTSVVVAKFSQAFGQALFIMLGIVFVVQGKLDFLSPAQRAAGLGAAALTMLLVATAIAVLTSEGRLADALWSRLGALASIRGPLKRFLARHPGRFAIATFFFGLGYAWGALEVLLICHFMGLELGLATALAVEVLSNVVDSLAFMVPAKLGTQEGGKALIFHGLGYGAAQGLAFGLIRHTREFVWASSGFLMYALSRKDDAASSPRAGTLEESAKASK